MPQPVLAFNGTGCLLDIQLGFSTPGFTLRAWSGQVWHAIGTPLLLPCLRTCCDVKSGEGLHAGSIVTAPLGNRYLLTADHCLRGGPVPRSADPDFPAITQLPPCLRMLHTSCLPTVSPTNVSWWRPCTNLPTKLWQSQMPRPYPRPCAVQTRLACSTLSSGTPSGVTLTSCSDSFA